MGKTGGKRRLVRPRRRWENNIKERLKLDGRAWDGLIWLLMGSGEHGHITRGQLSASQEGLCFVEFVNQKWKYGLRSS